MTNEKLMHLLLRDAGLLRRSASSETRGGAGILSHLKRDEGKTQQTLADEVGIRTQSVSEALSLLEERGHIRRVPSEKDKRAMLIFITEEGEKALEAANEDRRLRADKFFGSLTDGEKEILGEILIKLRDDNNGTKDRERRN